VRRIGRQRQSGAAGGIGILPIPDARTWPLEIRTWFHNAVGEAGPLDVFIFNHGQVAALYLQDAVTAAAVLDVHIEEWHTERGYPVFVFDPGRIDEVRHHLGLCGYVVRVLEPADGRRPHARRKPAAVVNISSARVKVREEQAQ
jgi:hypothetical protein